MYYLPSKESWMQKVKKGQAAARKEQEKTSVLSPSHKLTIEKPRWPNEHSAGHQDDKAETVPVSENNNRVAISDLGPGDTSATLRRHPLHRSQTHSI